MRNLKILLVTKGALCMPVQLGEHRWELGSKYLTRLESSNDLLDDPSALKERFAAQGYLLIRNFHDAQRIAGARSEFVAALHESGCLDPSYPRDKAVMAPGQKSMFWGGSAAQLQSQFPTFLEVASSPRTMTFFSDLLAGPALTYDYKWPRAVASGVSGTGLHYDVVFMGRGTKDVLTMWTPLEDVPLDHGPLALCLGSQHFERVKNTYGQMDVDRDNIEGDFSHDPMEMVEEFGGIWATSAFRAGDMLVFGMFMMHVSLRNATPSYRISADTRYQRADEPVDERWMGQSPKGHYAWGKTPMKPMGDARTEWGL